MRCRLCRWESERHGITRRLARWAGWRGGIFGSAREVKRGWRLDAGRREGGGGLTGWAERGSNSRESVGGLRRGPRFYWEPTLRRWSGGSVRGEKGERRLECAASRTQRPSGCRWKGRDSLYTGAA